MKRLIFTILAITAVATLSGCATSHSYMSVSGQIHRLRTPDKKVCNLVGKTADEAEKTLDMGKMDAISYSTTGEIRTYSKGNLRAILTIDKTNTVVNVDCPEITD